MNEDEARLARLRAKLQRETDPIERADLAASIAALEREIAALAERHTPQSTRLEITQTVAGSVSGTVAGAIFNGNVYLDGRRADQAIRLLGEYLDRLRSRCGSVVLEGVQQHKQLEEGERVSLRQVYTQLTIAGIIEREVFRGAALQALDLATFVKEHTGAALLPWQRRVELIRPMTTEEEQEYELRTQHFDVEVPKAHQRSESLEQLDLDALGATIPQLNQITFRGPTLVTDAIADQRHLVLLGEPGSGKSMVLRYLALTLAEAGLDPTHVPASALAGWERLSDQQRLLPMFVPLLPFARLLVATPTMTGSADELWSFLADQLEPGKLRTGLAEAVLIEIIAGNALVMLDGLDEVAGEESRRKVVRAVRLFAEEYRQCRIVVSCRVRAYEGELNRAWQLPGWPTVTLQEWDAAQRHHFVQAWFATAVTRGSLLESQRESRTADLQRAIAASPDLRRLAGRPLLLTIMALVHLNDGRLPEDRVTLYSRCIDILLAQWELRRDSEYGTLMQYIDIPDRDIKSLRPLLEQAAYVAHQASTPESPGNLGREMLRTMTMDYLAQKMSHPNAYAGTQKLLEYTDRRAGLIHASDAGDAYVFAHLTFQEYLAGVALTSGIKAVERIMEHRSDDRWRIPIQLGVGDQVSSNKLEIPYQLLQRLLTMRHRAADRYQRDLIFAAEIMADVGIDRLDQGGDEFIALRENLAQALVTVIEGNTLPAGERVRAGMLLGLLGDPRPGMVRFPPAMIAFPGGRFQIGNTEAEYQAIIAAEDLSALLQPRMLVVLEFLGARQPYEVPVSAQDRVETGIDGAAGEEMAELGAEFM